MERDAHSLQWEPRKALATEAISSFRAAGLDGLRFGRFHYLLFILASSLRISR
jgi:hypothetical protein